MISIAATQMRAFVRGRRINPRQFYYAKFFSHKPASHSIVQCHLPEAFSAHPLQCPTNDEKETPKSAPSDDQAAKPPLRILCLDGGGVRGLSSLVILRDFLARVQKAQGTDQPVLPADYFDLIIGTSTGGIMALMLGRLRMSVQEVQDMYLDLSKKVFSTGRISTAVHACATMYMNGIPSMYNETKLEKYVKDTIKNKPNSQGPEALLVDPSSDLSSCRTAVVTVRDNDATRPILMRSYTVPQDSNTQKFKVWEAARATSAAPIYFSPMKAGVDKVPYLDGCLSGHSNPSWLAMQEARRIWPDSEGRRIGLFLSLGTGSPSKVALQAPLRRFMLGFVYLSASTQPVHEMTRNEFKRKYEVSPYVRFSVDHHISKIRLDDPSSLHNITAATLSYLETARTSEEMQRCVGLATNEKPSKKAICTDPHTVEELEDTQIPPRHDLSSTLLDTSLDDAEPAPKLMAQSMLSMK